MAIHVLEEAERCLQCKNPQCMKGCPISTPIPTAIRLLREGHVDEAGKLLFENNPLTTVCCRVCNHEDQCEGHCVLGRKGQSPYWRPSHQWEKSGKGRSRLTIWPMMGVTN